MNFTGTVQKLVEILDLRKKKGFSCDTARVDPWAELFTQYVFVFPEFGILHFLHFHKFCFCIGSVLWRFVMEGGCLGSTGHNPRIETGRSLTTKYLAHRQEPSMFEFSNIFKYVPRSTSVLLHVLNRSA